MRLVDADKILEDEAFQAEKDTEFEPDPIDGSTIEPIHKRIKAFYRESIANESCGVAETIEVALVRKIGDGYEIIKVLK